MEESVQYFASYFETIWWALDKICIHHEKSSGIGNTWWGLVQCCIILYVEFQCQIGSWESTKRGNPAN
jgi:hypothetical protein